MPETDYVLYPLGFLQSPLKEPGDAPGQTIWKEEAAVALYAAVVFCVRAVRVR
jgi:hypothetical protein